MIFFFVWSSLSSSFVFLKISFCLLREVIRSQINYVSNLKKKKWCAPLFVGRVRKRLHQKVQTLSRDDSHISHTSRIRFGDLRIFLVRMYPFFTFSDKCVSLGNSGCYDTDSCCSANDMNADAMCNKGRCCNKNGGGCKEAM